MGRETGVVQSLFKMLEKEFRLRPRIEFDSLAEDFVGKCSPRIMEALEVAAEIHKGDFRKVSKEPYLGHCVAVASILSSWGADEEEIIAGLLHDTWEDHPEKISLEDIRKMFGERVMHLVDGVTKLKSREGEKNEFETLRKVTKESSIEPGVALVKLADRLHNMMTMEGMPAETQRKKALETLAVYAPLAESFGLWQIKNVLQDLSFRYADPKKYLMVKEKIDCDPRLTEKFIEKREREIDKVLAANNISARVEHQVGGYFEMAEKQKKYGMSAGARPNSFAEITDVVSFRIITDDKNTADCYTALGLVRLFYDGKLMKQRHNDYLATPSANGYSALHDTYRFEEGDVELSFTTSSKERFNNWGVVSIAKETLRKNPEEYKRKLIFTPKKELVFMEMSATGIDVAYKLNLLLGLRAVGVIVDGEMRGLQEIVPNSSIVEVVCDADQKLPNSNWLHFCNQATRRLVEQQLVVAQRDEEVYRGKQIISDQVLADRGIIDLSDLNERVLDKLLINLGCWHGLSDLYYKVAYGLDLNIIRKKMDESGIVRGMYTSIQVCGENEIGISKEVAEIVSRNGGDARSKVEKVDEQERFLIRILLTVGYEGKKKIEQELREKYPGCMVV